MKYLLSEYKTEKYELVEKIIKEIRSINIEINNGNLKITIEILNEDELMLTVIANGNKFKGLIVSIKNSFKMKRASLYTFNIVKTIREFDISNKIKLVNELLNKCETNSRLVEYKTNELNEIKLSSIRFEIESMFTDPNGNSNIIYSKKLNEVEIKNNLKEEIDLFIKKDINYKRISGDWGILGIDYYFADKSELHSIYARNGSQKIVTWKKSKNPNCMGNLCYKYIKKLEKYKDKEYIEFVNKLLDGANINEI